MLIFGWLLGLRCGRVNVVMSFLLLYVEGWCTIRCLEALKHFLRNISSSSTASQTSSLVGAVRMTISTTGSVLPLSINGMESCRLTCCWCWWRVKYSKVNVDLSPRTPTEQEPPDLYWPATGCRWRFAAGSGLRPEYQPGRSAASGPLSTVRRRHATNGPAPGLRNWASTIFYIIGFLSTVLLWYAVVLFYV